MFHPTMTMLVFGSLLEISGHLEVVRLDGSAAVVFFRVDKKFFV